MKRTIPVSPASGALLLMGLICTSCRDQVHDYVIETLATDKTQVSALPEGGNYDIHALTVSAVVLSQPEVSIFDTTIYHSVTPTQIDAKWFVVSIDANDRRSVHIQVSPNDTDQERSGSFSLYSENFDAMCWVTVVQPCMQ